MRRFEMFRLTVWCWWMDVRGWCERVIYCQHNARVLAEMEWRLSVILERATGGKLSKAYYDVPTMTAWIDNYVEECCDDARREAVEDYTAEQHTRVVDATFLGGLPGA